MKFDTCAFTNVGGRSNNEDYYLCGDNFWLVADGLGGHDSGEVASKTAAEAVEKFVKKNKSPMNGEYIDSIIKTANMAVIDAQKKSKELESMRTTVVFAITDGEILKYANVGDSRFYYFRNGKIIAQSEDHTVSAALAKLGEISYSDIRKDPDKNKLAKVLGEKENLSVKLPETVIIPQNGDAFLLCSDGFWEYVYETEMETDFAKAASSKEWISYMAKRIILRTGNNGNDNFTALAVMIEG